MLSNLPLERNQCIPVACLFQAASTESMSRMLSNVSDVKHRTGTPMNYSYSYANPISVCICVQLYCFIKVQSYVGDCHRIQTLILTLICCMLICSYSIISTLSPQFLINVQFISAVFQPEFSWGRLLLSM